MSKRSSVLRALQILGLEDMLKLSQALAVQQVFKKAAGAELIVWDETPSKGPGQAAPPETQAKILNFPNQKVKDLLLEEQREPLTEEQVADSSGITACELVLWQRAMGKESEQNLQKLDAFKGYKKLTQMYAVKNDLGAKAEKLRFAATQGVLVNKRQAQLKGMAIIFWGKLTPS